MWSSISTKDIDFNKLLGVEVLKDKTEEISKKKWEMYKPRPFDSSERSKVDS